jgi:hypothetical protein
MDIEKSDVDLSKLFRWEGEVEIKDQKGDVATKVYMRIVGDKDLNQARVYALRQSADLRAKLRDKESDEYKAFIREALAADKENLLAGIKLLSMEEITRQARENVVVKFPKEPDTNASLEEQEKYQKTVDEFPEKFGDLVRKEAEKILKNLEKDLKKLSDEEIQNEYVSKTINYVCTQEMNRSFVDRCVFGATYRDSEFKEKYFLTFDNYENLATEVKEQLREGYQNLELGMQEIKKLPEATQ